MEAIWGGYDQKPFWVAETLLSVFVTLNGLPCMGGAIFLLTLLRTFGVHNAWHRNSAMTSSSGRQGFAPCMNGCRFPPVTA